MRWTVLEDAEAIAAWRAGDRSLPVACIEARTGGEVLLDRGAAETAD